jgi:two-component system sensor histidine kinase PilS (NtrC family)
LILEHRDPTYRIFHIYRLSLSGILLASYLLLGENFFAFVHSPWIFLITSVTWFFVTTITSFSSFLSRHLDWLSCTNFLIDVIALSILGWASNGLEGGIYFLMLPSAALAGLMLPMRLALLVASTATLATFAAQTALILDFRLPPTVYFPSGVLGLLLFLSTVTFLGLARRIAKSQQEAREHLKTAEGLQQLNQQIIDRMQTGVIVLDADLQIQTANHSARRMLGEALDPNELIEGKLEDFPELFTAFQEWKKKPNRPVSSFTHKSSGISLQPGFSLLESQDNSQVFVWLDDTRDLRQRAQMFKLQSLGKISSGLAHEVRNPLSAVQQANDLLLHSPSLSEADRELTGIIERHCVRMNEIIDAVQQLSRSVEPTPYSINLSEWIDEMINEFREGHADIDTGEIDTDIGKQHQVYFDSRHLKQILGNILENGIRHGDPEEPRQLIKTTKSKNGRYVYIDLKDNGPGISPKDQKKIFDPFFTMDQGGSGLGLYLAREFCEANFASINYLYEGTEQNTGYFRITCPVESPRS